MVLKFSLIAAACENMGIGKNGDLPWRLNLRSEMDFFSRMTSTTKDPNKKNVVLMGRRTWESIPKKYKPLQNRINFVLSSKGVDLSGFQDCYQFSSLDNAVKKLKDNDFLKEYEQIWVIGGSAIYEITMKSEHFYRLYLTEVQKTYDCDTFFPKLVDNLSPVEDPNVPKGVQEEKGITFVYKVYQNSDIK